MKDNTTKEIMKQIEKVAILML